MKNIEFKFEKGTYRKVTMCIDGNEAGYIEFSGEEIMYSFIEEEFRGKGLYKMLLIAALNLGGYVILYSFNRNEFSNPVYQKWMNEDNLSENENIAISLDGEKVDFTKVSEL
jgi:GNAT superfamily N-acetyltransferase